jgi:hypothetical protein
MTLVTVIVYLAVLFFAVMAMGVIFWSGGVIWDLIRKWWTGHDFDDDE